jgi:AraC-like DNA-binding protein
MPSAYCSVILKGHAASEPARAALLKGTGISTADLTTGNDITLGQQLRQIHNAERLLHPGWSLETGVNLNAATHGPNGVAIVCAPSLRIGLQTLTRFAHLRAPHFRFRGLVSANGEARIVAEDCVALKAAERRPLLDLVMLSTQAVIEAQLGRPMYEGRFEFPYPAPEHARRYADFFHAPVRFGREEAAVVFPTTWLSLESSLADPAVHVVALEHVRMRASRLRDSWMLIARVEQILAQRGARLGMRQVARLLGMSDRTLTRRLAGEGTSFQVLLDNSLKSQAAELLQDDALTAAEVAYVLGYEDPANFGRAFRRWFGTSPRKFRSRLELEGNSDGSRPD